MQALTTLITFITLVTLIPLTGGALQVAAGRPRETRAAPVRAERRGGRSRSRQRRVGKMLSYLLRHGAKKQGVILDEAGTGDLRAIANSVPMRDTTPPTGR